MRYKNHLIIVGYGK